VRVCFRTGVRAAAPAAVMAVPPSLNSRILELLMAEVVGVECGGGLRVRGGGVQGVGKRTAAPVVVQGGDVARGGHLSSGPMVSLEINVLQRTRMWQLI
jgi:hypothetical protein